MARRRDEVATYPRSWKDADNLIGTKDNMKKIDHNTRLERWPNSSVVLTLHHHPIVHFAPTGEISAAHAGFISATTVSRIAACGLGTYRKLGAVYCEGVILGSSFNFVGVVRK